MNTKSLAGLRILLIGFLVAWILYMMGMYQGTKETPYDIVTYIWVAATTALGLASLLAKRRAVKSLGTGDPHAVSVNLHAIAGIIISMVIAAWAIVALFISMFTTEYTNATERLVNTYIPIILFTALLVVLLLYGFVFNMGPEQDQPFPYSTPPHPRPAEPLENTTNALAYAIPIIGGAIAAIIAGIIYDVTGTKLTAWIWVIVIAIVTIGLILGTHFSSKLSRPAGAHSLNAAWTIALAAVVGLMSMGFGASAIEELRVYSNLGINVYDDGSQTPQIEVNGNGLKPRSEVVVEVNGETVHTSSADAEGWYWVENIKDIDFPHGDSEIVASGTTKNGVPLTAKAIANTNENGTFMKNEKDAYASYTSSAEITGSWIVSHLLPAFLMALAVTIVLYVTELQRVRVRVRALPPAPPVPPVTPEEVPQN